MKVERKQSKKGKQFSCFSTFLGANSQIQTQVGGNEHHISHVRNSSRLLEVMNLLVPLTFHLLTLTNILSHF